MHTIGFVVGTEVFDSQRHQNESFQRALLSLSQTERECIHLRLEGFAYDDIAYIMQVRTDTVRALLAGALRKIRKL